LSLLSACGSRGATAADPYARPGRLVALPDGRHLNMRCTGRGSPTVLLESGWGGNSGGWYKVQPALARTTRVCSYDRAGYGFSDPGPLPRDGAAIARDLDQALTAGKIGGPFVVVGHSAGGLYARLFAARRLPDVQGLILLDPTVERRSPRPSGDGLDGIRRRLQRCLQVLETTPQDPEANPNWAGCASPKADPHTAQILRRPETWRQQLSELDEIFGRASDQVFRLNDLLRPIPSYVITASETAMATPSISIGSGGQSALEYMHQVIAAQSRNGSQRTVLSSHLIMIDRPDVVIDAAEEMVRATRRQQLPAPLPPNETSPLEPSPFAMPEPEPDPFKGASVLEFPPVTK
jgi:pimeloyl-ACP methyl ester carboxylesterase